MRSKGILAGALAALMACGGQARDPRPIAGSWFGDIEALGEHGHSGFAVVSLVPDGGTRANLTLSGGSAGGNHPWAMHEGLCGSDGAVVGDSSAYPPLRPDERGNASATVMVADRLDPDGEYSISIRQSSEDDTLVGCGNLVSNR